MCSTRTRPGPCSRTRPTCGASMPPTPIWCARPCTTRCRCASPARHCCAAAGSWSCRASTRPVRWPRSSASRPPPPSWRPPPCTGVMARAAGPARFASLRLLVHAGSPCPAPLKRAALRRLRPGALWEFYGSTEGQFTVCSPEEWLQRPGTVGRARPGRRLEVDDDGVVWCHAPGFARFEYWRDPRGHGAGVARRRLHRRRPGPSGRGRVPLPGGPPRRPHHQRWGQRVPRRGGVGAGRGARGRRGGRLRRRRRRVGRAGVRGGGGRPSTRPTCVATPRGAWPPTSAPRRTSSWASSPTPPTGKLRRRDLPAVLGLAPPTADRPERGPGSSAPPAPWRQARVCREPPGWAMIWACPSPPSTPPRARPRRSSSPTPTSRCEAKLALAERAFATYRATSFEERAHLAGAAAELLEGEIPDIARVLTTEMGKTFASAKGEVAKCAAALRWFAEHAERLLADEAVTTAAQPEQRALRAHGAGAGRHALELPDVAGDAVRGPGPHGRQRRPVEARLERAPDGAAHRGRVPAGRVSRRRLPDPARPVLRRWRR